MKSAIVPVLLTGLILSVAIGFGFLVHSVENRPPADVRPVKGESTLPAVATTPKLLTVDPAFYTGKLVHTATEGAERLSPVELGYRPRADLPFSVVLRFAVPVPDPLPQFVVGTCLGRVENGPVVVVDCRGQD